MRAETRSAFNRYLDQQAKLNDADPETVKREKAFTVTPSIQQKLIDRQQEDSTFLKKINIVTVREQSGSGLGLSVGGTLARRTNTATTDRPVTDPSSLDERQYTCKQTNSDTAIKYSKLDLWAKFPDFQTRIRNMIVRRQALDRIMIGFNGVSAAVSTDPTTYPLLQDVNVGWLEGIRGYNTGARVLDEGEVEDGKIIIDPDAGDYKNVHALVQDAVYNLLPAWAREDSGLVAILGSDLMHDTFFPLINSDLVPTETIAADVIISSKRVGGKPAAAVPFFPTSSILITRFDNLSIYEQDEKRRRTIVDNAKRDQIENYESTNDAYFVEDMDYACLIENVQFGPTPD